MIAETIHWHDAKDVAPSPMRLVLVEDEAGIVVDGMIAFDKQTWVDAKGFPIWGRPVIAWAEKPQGSLARRKEVTLNLVGAPGPATEEKAGCGCTRQNRDWNCKLHN
jgi:hypothetical protein